MHKTIPIPMSYSFFIAITQQVLKAYFAWKQVKVDYSKNIWKEENRRHSFVSWLATYQWEKIIENCNSVGTGAQKVGKVVKGYLHYKTIILKMCYLRYRLRIFLFQRKVRFCSQDIQDFVFLTILWFNKSVTSWWALVYETEYIFEYIFWTTTH